VGVQENIRVSISVAVEVTEEGSTILVGPSPTTSAKAERVPSDDASAPLKIPLLFGQIRGPGPGFAPTKTPAEVVPVWLVFPHPVLETTLADVEKLPARAGRQAKATPQHKRNGNFMV
jgi:hypothetical protein